MSDVSARQRWVRTAGDGQGVEDLCQVGIHPSGNSSVWGRVYLCIQDRPLAFRLPPSFRPLSPTFFRFQDLRARFPMEREVEGGYTLFGVCFPLVDLDFFS